jgi:PAS domain S-box-containing protein
MFESSLDGVIIADETGVILEFNEAAKKMFGWRSDEVIGRTIETMIIPERLRAKHRAGMARFRAEHRSTILGQRLELPAVDREGREFPTEITIALIDAGGRTRFSAFIRDISARKRAEQETQAAREAAEAASKAKTEFLAMVSHEFRTPMNGIIGLAEMLRTTALDGKQSSYLEGIEESSRRLMVLTTDILDFSRIEAGRLQIQPTTFDLRVLIERAERTTRALVVGKPVLVASEIAETLPRYVVGDPNRLSQVLANLLSNSAKFTERGEVRICARELDGAAPGSVRLHVEVSDTGSGIPASLRDRMFKPFEQGNADISRQHGGSGLGLAICKRLLDLMGGRISFVSDESFGASFSIVLDLPIGRVENAERKGEKLLLTCQSESLSVLVAEDTPTSQLVVRAMLEQLGHRATIASNGKMAVELASELPFDLVLMDIQMPVMDGIEATRWIRALSGRAGRLPIIAMSAQVLPAALERASEAGMNGHVSKPLTLQSLAAAIARGCQDDKLGAADTKALSDAPTDTSASPSDVASEELSQALDALRAQIGDQAIDGVLQHLMTDCSQILESVAAAIDAGDNDQLRKLAHKLNGLFGQFGLETARGLAEKVELSADGSELLNLSADLAGASDLILNIIAETAQSVRITAIADSEYA